MRAAAAPPRASGDKSTVVSINNRGNFVNVIGSDHVWCVWLSAGAQLCTDYDPIPFDACCVVASPKASFEKPTLDVVSRLAPTYLVKSNAAAASGETMRPPPISQPARSEYLDP